MSIDLAKRIRSSIESAKTDLDLARQQCQTTATLQPRRLCAAVQVGRAFTDGVDGGMSLPGEEWLILCPARPLSDETALQLWQMSVADAIRAAHPSRLKGRSGMLDFSRVLTDKNGKALMRDGKPAKAIKTKASAALPTVEHKGKKVPNVGCKLDGELATDRDHLDEATLLEIERRIAADWSDLFGLLIESVQPTDEDTRETKPEKSRKATRKKPTVKLGNNPQITIDDEAYSLTFEQAHWLKALIDAGDWMSDRAYNGKHDLNSRPDRLRKDLPDAVRAHITTTKSSGSRWR